MTRLHDPLLPESLVACPDCGAPVGDPCRGIEVHPEYGPLGVHIARVEVARARRVEDQPGQDEPTEPEPAVMRGRERADG